MVIIKSYSVGDGDMFCIRHGSDNFTIIDCNLEEGQDKIILEDIAHLAKDKTIQRFISTHPDEDHIQGIGTVIRRMGIVNFYCTKNKAIKTSKVSKSFDDYCQLRDDPKKAFPLFKDCERCWLNRKTDDRDSSGINILWPDIDNQDYKDALENCANGGKPNNISPIIRYQVENGVSALWMGDLEADFMEKIIDKVSFLETDIVFAPHHGRKSGKIPEKWLKQINPNIIVIGEANSDFLNYYERYHTITQNQAKDITFCYEDEFVHIFITGTQTNEKPFLMKMKNTPSSDMIKGTYLGSFKTKRNKE